MRPLNETVINNQNAASNLNSNATDASQLFAASVQGIATGTIVGTIQLQGSNDPGSVQQNTTPSNWSDISSASVSVSSAGVYLIPKTDLCYQWIRVTYTATSGAGNLTVNVKALGA